MAEMSIVAKQVVEFFVLMAVGFIGSKCKVLTKQSLDGIMKLIVKILLPCLICKVMLGSGVTKEDYWSNAGFALAILVCYGILLLAGLGVGKMLGLKGTTFNVFAAEFTFGDMGFIGIPLLTSVFGDVETSIAISVYTVIDMALLWTLGVYLCSRHNQKNDGKTDIWKNMISPTSVVLAAGLILVFCGVKLPDVVMNPITSIGNASTPLALIYIGGMLSFVPFQSLLARKSIFGIVGVKMLVLPVLVYLAAGLIFGMRERMTLMYMVGLPAMTTISMLASLYESDQEYATSTVFITTLACLVTLPAITWISGGIG